MSPIAAMRLVTNELAVEGIPERTGHLRHHLDGAGGTRGDRREPRSELHRSRGVPDDRRDRAAASGCSQRSSTHRERRPGLAPRGRPRRSCSARCRSNGSGASAARPPESPLEAEPRLRGRRARGLGEVLPLLRRRAANRSPLQPGKYTIGPEDVEPHLDENTIGVAAVVGTTFTGHADDVVGINDLLIGLRDEKGLDIPPHRWGERGLRLAVPVPGLEVGLPARAGSLDQRVRPQVRTRTPDRLADLSREVRPRRGPRLLRELPGKTDATFTLNFSTGSAMVLAQYYNFVRFGKGGTG